MSVLAFGALCFSSLLTVIDPFGAAPIFASLTASMDPAARRRVAFRASLAALAVLAVFAVGGSALLRLFGVTIEAFRIAGGIVFGMMGLAMLKEGESHEKASASNDDPSIVPIGIPLIGGPGAMTTAMVLAGQARSPLDALALGVSILAVLAVTWSVLAAAPSLLARFGPTGVTLTTKIMGLVVLVIGVQFVIDGLVPVARDIVHGAPQGAMHASETTDGLAPHPEEAVDE